MNEVLPGQLVIVNDRNPLMFTKEALLRFFHFIGYDRIEFINDYGPITDRTLAMKLCYARFYYSQDPCSDDHADRLAGAIGVPHLNAEDLTDMVLNEVADRCDEKGEKE